MAIADSTNQGYAQLSVTTAQGLGTLPGKGETACIIVAEGNAARWRDDGTDPTAAIGMPLAVGTPYTFNGNLSKFRVISQTGTATLNVVFFSVRNH
jgi:hypothetical protein